MHLLDLTQDPFFLLEIICKIKQISAETQVREYFYVYNHVDATRHLFRVTAGLDSLIIGEKQILGQVRSAFAQAQEFSLFQQHFNILSNLAIRVGKKAQTETEISWGGSSIGWAAVMRAEQIVGSLKDKLALVIGAGKMSQLTLAQMSTKGLQKLYLMNRTYEKAKPMAESFNAEFVSFYDLKETLSKVDVCICAVNAPHYIMEKDFLQNVVSQRGDRPLVIIDIAVPRNVDPAAAQIKGVILYSVDDLAQTITQTMAKREAAMTIVENIVENKIVEFYEKIQKLKDFESALKPVK